MRAWARLATLLSVAPLVVATAGARDISIGGFIPYVGLTLTDEFKDGDALSGDGTFFISEPEFSLVGGELTGSSPSFVHDIALLDTGAATHILTPRASGVSGFDIEGNDFDGTNIQPIGGATGVIDLKINDPLGVFVTGAGNRTSAGANIGFNRSTFRGQTSFATLSAPEEWTLPNIIGLPMAAHHKIVIRNDQPQVFEYEGRTTRTPNVEFKDLGSGGEGIVRRTDLRIRPGTAFVTGPIYVQNLDILSGQPFHENPLSPSLLENAAMFLEVDMQDGSKGFQDKELLFDTGADFTVISTLTAARLGFDAVLDTPDFLLEVEGSGGVQGGVPGIYLDELNIDTVGGSFTLQNVPVAVLDVTNPNDPGNVIDGIIGMHLFNGRNLVIDTNPSIGQGGVGPSLYIGDPVTTKTHWQGPAGGWSTAAGWSTASVPTLLSEVCVDGGNVLRMSTAGEAGTVTVAAGGASKSTLLIQSGGTLTTFGEVKIEDGGIIEINEGGKLDAQFMNIEVGTLRGGGDIFVGTGPITSPVRNISGRVEPGDGIGTLTIDGDFANLADGIVYFELGGTMADIEHDQLTASRFAFLGGVLSVGLVDSFTPQVGQMFALITAGEGVQGEFDNLLLPAGFDWSVDYTSTEVRLTVEALVAGLPGDFNNDGRVDLGDYTVWRDNLGVTYTAADYQTWREHFGQTQAAGGIAQTAVPEPSAALLAALALAGGWHARRMRQARL